MGTERIEKRFASLKSSRKAAFVPFVTAGDPDTRTSTELLRGLVDAGADMIELGIPFSDPMADGPAIQAASLRALKAGATLRSTLQQVREFREQDQDTPLVLMGYFNPLLSYGLEQVAQDAASSGVDGLIIVDLPPEEETEFRPFADAAGLSVIRLIAPTTDDDRLAQFASTLSGWVYLISITGVTGTKSIDVDAIRPHIERTRSATGLPVGVGFGVKSPQDAKSVAQIADAVVVGSALVDRVYSNLTEAGEAMPSLVSDVQSLVKSLADAVHSVEKA